MESKVFLSEHEPDFSRGDSYKLVEEDVIVKEVYKKRLEDLTFNELNMFGYTNPNLFVKEWASEHGLFDKDRIVWVVVYGEVEK